MSIGFDTNVLIYSFDNSDPGKHVRAQGLMDHLLNRKVAVPTQVISETLAAAHRKRHLSVPDARVVCDALVEALAIEPLVPNDAIAASRLAEDHKLQFFDAQMIVVHMRLGTSILLSEDLQDGRRFGEMQILNPFSPSNDAFVEAVLTPQP